MSFPAPKEYVEAKLKECLGDTVYIRIRPDIIEKLIRFGFSGEPVGGFLTAVLSNDLREACARADSDNRRVLFEITTLVYNELPAPCWGSEQKVEDWIEKLKENSL